MRLKTKDICPAVCKVKSAQRLRIALLVLGAFVFAPSIFAQWTSVGTGIDYRAITITMADAKPNNLFLARMALSNTNCIIGSMIAANRVAGTTERTSAQASRYEDALNYWGQSWGQRNDVVVAINGSFFSGGVITGGHIYDGWYAKQFQKFGGQLGFVWKFDRSHFIGVCLNYPSGDQTVTLGSGSRKFDGINTNRETDKLIIYTPQWDNNTLTDNSGVEVLVEMSTPLLILAPSSAVTGTTREVRIGQGATKIPFDHIVLSGAGTGATFLQNYAQVGQTVSINQRLLLYDGPRGSLCSTSDSRNLNNTYALAQGNFNFLKNSVIQPTTDAGMIARNPRTFVAYNSTYVFFGVCDGRTTASAGMTSDEMGAFCITNLLATDGVNMDGGGSSTMWVNGAVKNRPSDGSERRVANGLMMVVLQPKTNSTTFAIGQNVKTTTTANFRLGPGTDYFSFMTLANGAQGTVLNHGLNGISAKGYYWWKCDFNGTSGWIAESTLAASANPPSITLQPTNQIVATGGSASFTVTATGSNPLHHQWQKNSMNLTNGGHYSGCTNATLAIAGADTNDAASYRCVVTNAYGSSNSLIATLTVLDPPSIPTANPASEITSHSLTANWVSATGATGYRLDVSTNIGFGSYVAGYQNLDVGNTLNWSVTGLIGGITHYYRLRAYNEVGTSGNSDAVAVTLLPPSPCYAILNADFESGFSLAGGGYIADDWTEWEADADVVIGYDETGITHSGAHCQRIRVRGGTSGSAGGVFQRIPAAPGVAFTISAWMYAEDGATLCSLGVDPAGGTNAASGVTWSSVSTNIAWVQKTVAGTTMADHLTVFLKVASTDDNKRNGYFDDAAPGIQSLQLAVQQNGNELTLFWPQCPDALLQQTTNLYPPALWTIVTNEPTVADGQKSVTLTPMNDAGYFRLNQN